MRNFALSYILRSLFKNYFYTRSSKIVKLPRVESKQQSYCSSLPECSISTCESPRLPSQYFLNSVFSSYHFIPLLFYLIPLDPQVFCQLALVSAVVSLYPSEVHMLELNP